MPYKLLAAPLLAVTMTFAALPCTAQEAAGEDATVIWSHPRCEYILIKKSDGHGVITQFSAERLKENDVITADFSHSVNSGKKFVIKSTGETGMLRGAAYELSRAQALKKIKGICSRFAPQE